MNQLLHVSSSPHVRSKTTTQTLMLDVIIAMLPTTIFGVVHFGVHALLVLIATVAACVISEYAFERGLKKPITVTDLSAVVTGMILALNMPPEIPIWIPVLGGVFAIIVVKQIYGGLGQNFMNPALAARCFLLISFAGKMTDFSVREGVKVVDSVTKATEAVTSATSSATSAVSGATAVADAVSGATPLAVLKSGGSVDVLSMFIGNISGTIGEVSTICLLIGAAYLVARKVISIRIPAAYILTTLVFVAIFGGHGLDVNYLAAHLFGGGLIFGAFFMATDYVTSPITPMGQIAFGVILGVLTGLFRLFGGSAEGVSYAIIISNILAPLIEKATLPKAFGKEGKKA